MLVLSRLRNQSIIIGDNVIVTIVDIRGDKVKLGIDAPIEVPVDREEIHRKKKRQAKRAAAAAEADDTTTGDEAVQ